MKIGHILFLAKIELGFELDDYFLLFVTKILWRTIFSRAILWSTQIQPQHWDEVEFITGVGS